MWFGDALARAAVVRHVETPRPTDAWSGGPGSTAEQERQRQQRAAGWVCLVSVALVWWPIAEGQFVRSCRLVLPISWLGFQPVERGGGVPARSPGSPLTLPRHTHFSTTTACPSPTETGASIGPRQILPAQGCFNHYRIGHLSCSNAARSPSPSVSPLSERPVGYVSQ